MTLTADQFRADFPEFADPIAYPDAQVSAWTAIGASFINEERWGPPARLGAELVAAHFLVIAKREQQQALAGAVPGEVKGILASKSVGDVSAGYDVSSLLGEGDGFWNGTTYGLRFRKLQRIFGAGGVQLGSLCF